MIMDGETTATVLTIAIIVLASGLLAAAYYSSAEETQITVVEKITKYHGGDEKYLVSTESGEIFEIADTIAFLRFDSSNVYFSLEEGQTYTCKVAGWRIPFLSMYRNIIEVK